jgi:hypothetical protein
MSGGFFFGMGPSLVLAASRQRYNRDRVTLSSSASSCTDWPGLFSLRTAFAWNSAVWRLRDFVVTPTLRFFVMHGYAAHGRKVVKDAAG